MHINFSSSGLCALRFSPFPDPKWKVALQALFLWLGRLFTFGGKYTVVSLHVKQARKYYGNTNYVIQLKSARDEEILLPMGSLLNELISFRINNNVSINTMLLSHA